MSALSVHVISATLTERLLLLLGWDKVKSTRENVYGGKKETTYQELKKVNQNLRKRLQATGLAQGSGARPTSASWEQNAPTLRPMTIATSQPESLRASAWSSDGAAFDAAATGTV